MIFSGRQSLVGIYYVGVPFLGIPYTRMPSVGILPQEVCVGRAARSWLAQDLGVVKSARVADEKIQQGGGVRKLASYLSGPGFSCADPKASYCSS